MGHSLCTCLGVRAKLTEIDPIAQVMQPAGTSPSKQGPSRHLSSSILVDFQLGLTRTRPPEKLTTPGTRTIHTTNKTRRREIFGQTALLSSRGPTSAAQFRFMSLNPDALFCAGTSVPRQRGTSVIPWVSRRGGPTPWTVYPFRSQQVCFQQACIAYSLEGDSNWRYGTAPFLTNAFS